MKPTYRKDQRPAGLVLGTAGLGGVWRKIDPRESIETILFALENDIDRLDTAPAYNMGEELVGKALHQWKGERPFVSTKVGRLRGKTADDLIVNYEPAVMEQSVSQSLERLQRQQLDLLFLHEPEQVPVDQIKDVVDFLVDLKRSGKAAKIGFGGIPPEVYYPFIRKGLFDVAMGYNNLDAACLDGMQSDVPFLRKKGLTIYQGSPLHMGLLGNRFENYAKSSPEWISDTAVANARKSREVAGEAGISLPDLAHRFILSVKEVDYMVLGARNMKQLKQSLGACQKGVLEEDIFNQICHQLQ